jgi:hypothetical protein
MFGRLRNNYLKNTKNKDEISHAQQKIILMKINFLFHMFLDDCCESFDLSLLINQEGHFGSVIHNISNPDYGKKDYWTERYTLLGQCGTLEDYDWYNVGFEVCLRIVAV